MVSDKSLAKEHMNFRINPEYIKILTEMEKFTGKSPLEFVNSVVRNEIKFILERPVHEVFPDYVDDIVEKLDIVLDGDYSI